MKKVGDIFEYGRFKLIVRESTVCTGCVFDDYFTGCNRNPDFPVDLTCYSGNRLDRTSVIFTFVKPFKFGK